MTTRREGRLAGSSALITGASRGIGLAIAREFAREGADLLLVATREDTLAAARAALAGFGTRLETRAADITAPGAAATLVDAAVRAFGKLDVLVNNAGVYVGKPFLEYDEADVDRTLAVNVKAPMFLMQAALAHMAPRGYGRIVNLASTAGKWASRNQAVYNLSKHAVVGLTRCAALEFAAQGVTVNAICPGLVRTEMADSLERNNARATGATPESVHADLLRRIAQGRFLEPVECAHLAVYMASAEAAGMTGQSVLLDGGMVFV